MRRIKRSGLWLCVLCLLLPILFPGTAFAQDSEVVYESDAKRFVFLPQGQDLFGGLKDVMPGDVLHQTVTLRSSRKNHTETQLYLKAENAQNEEFLSQLQMTIRLGDQTLSQGSVEQTGGLIDWTPLISLKPGEFADLELELTVPLELSDAYQEQAGIIKWRFKADEAKPAATPQPTASPAAVPALSPQTGDASPGAGFLMGISGFALLAIALLLIHKNRKEHKSKA